MNLETGEIKNSTYFMQWWREMPAAPKKRWRLFLASFALFWLAGAVYAPTAVAGIARLTGLARLLMSLAMGGFTFLWRGLKGLGLIEETVQQPNLLWLLLALALPGVVFGFVYLLDQAPNPLFSMQKMVTSFAHSQGRLKDEDAGARLAITRGVPYALVGQGKQQVKVGLDYAAGEGHLLVSGPTRSGKGLHLTDALLTWPGPALVVDPKAEQLARTAAWRSQFGPIYCLPGHQTNLAAYYRQLLDRDDVAELHTHLLRPWAGRESIFAEKALSLFTAVGLYAQARRLDPIRVLLDLAESDPEEALAGLEQVPAAKRHVRIFTNGAKPNAYRDDKFVTSAFGNFTTRLATYQKHVDTIAPPETAGYRVIDPDWARRNGTVYITYSLQDLQGVGGVVAAVIAAMLRYQMQRAGKERLLVAIDELPAVGLRNIADYLATCGGYGITLLLYIQSMAQLKGLYGAAGTGAILSNCAHQVWYPPTEYETAEVMSRLYGLTLRANPAHATSRGSRQHQVQEGQTNTQTNHNQSASWAWHERPELAPSQMMALPKEQVLVTSHSPGTGQASTGGQQVVFLGRRLNPIPLFDQLPAPSLLRLPHPVYRPRRYTAWRQTDAAPPSTPADSKPGAESAGHGAKDRITSSAHSRRSAAANPGSGVQPDVTPEPPVMTDQPAASSTPRQPADQSEAENRGPFGAAKLLG
jgi:type IV secretory pathway TraG/TraD family ATPase VirD4